MPTVTFVQPNGTRTSVELVPGSTLMQLALNNSVPGILGECGGCAQCATCHVYTDSAGVALLPPVAAAEDALLECTVSDRLPGSRLSCQIAMTAAMDGLVVTIPPKQI